MQISGKPIKVFFHGKRLKDIYPFAMKWEMIKFRIVRFLRKLLIAISMLSIASIIGYTGFEVGRALFPITVMAQQRVEVPIEISAPVMERIAKCESNASHYRNGQVIMNANKDRTVDIGYYQINSIHAKKATELGYDLTQEADNKAFGLWLYKNYGTEPWYSTKDCWNK